MYRWPLYHSYRLVVPVVVWCCSDINTQSHWWHKIARAQRKLHPETAQESNYLRNRQIRIANMERCLKYLLCDCVWGTKADKQAVHGPVSPARGELAALIMMYAIWKTWTAQKFKVTQRLWVKNRGYWHCSSGWCVPLCFYCPLWSWKEKQNFHFSHFIHKAPFDINSRL